MRIPACTRADSNVKLHPSRNETMSSRQTWEMSVGSSTSSPYSKTRYLGRSVLRSAPGAIARGSDEPASTTSSRGHGLGLRWQKSRKSNACSFGSITRLACTRPGAIPLVRPLSSPRRINALSSLGAVGRAATCCMVSTSNLLESPHSTTRPDG